MPLKAAEQLRRNLEYLLMARKETQVALAFATGIDKSTINKFLKGTRELQLADLDKVADYFGVETHQLFQPGISRFGERRSGIDRRAGKDRRIGHHQRALVDLADRIGLARHGRPKGGRDAHRGVSAAAATLPEHIRRELRAVEARLAALYAQADAWRQTAASGDPRPRPRKGGRVLRGPDVEKA